MLCSIEFHFLWFLQTAHCPCIRCSADALLMLCSIAFHFLWGGCFSTPLNMTPEQINLMSIHPLFPKVSANGSTCTGGRLSHSCRCCVRVVGRPRGCGVHRSYRSVGAVCGALIYILAPSASAPTSSLEPIDVIAVSVQCVVHF